MKLRLMLMSFLALALAPVAAEADISGGPVFSGGGSQNTVRCMLFNAGPGTATLGRRAITTGGVPVSLSQNGCGASLGAGKACVIAAGPVTQVLHACKFVSTGGVLRGVIAVYGASDQLLHSSDMR